MPDDELSIPTEVSWQLLATSMTSPILSDTDSSSISVFTYVPKLESLEKDYPNDRLVYLKFTASVSPISVAGIGSDGTGRDPFDLLGARDYPVWRTILDVTITGPGEKREPGSLKPYFLSASPVRREMVEMGVVGREVYEGESTGLAVGKSGSQLHESFRTSTETSETSVGGFAHALFVGAGIAHTSSETTVGGGRQVTQVTDSTQRNASDERRELFSHLTNVSNILCLLRTTLVGTPHLRFDLVPRPLRPLTLDPFDPNLWYARLLNRRSSGIEGVQDFYAIAVVPRAAKGFCVKANFRRVFVIEPPLPPSDFAVRDFYSPATTARILNYLYLRYPVGTPLDQLDLDLGPEQFTDVGKMLEWAEADLGPGFSPAVIGWVTTDTGNVMVRVVLTTTVNDGTAGKEQRFAYKTRAEVYLEMVRHEYETELAKSPLERGFVFQLPLTLSACQDLGEPGRPPVTSFTVTEGDLTKLPEIVDFTPYVPLPALSLNPSTGQNIYSAAYLSWNAMETQFASQLSVLGPERAKPFRFDDPRVLDLLLSTAANLAPDAPANQSLGAVAGLFGLAPEQLGALKASGVGDLRTLAAVVKFAPAAELREREQAASRAPAPPKPSGRGCNFLQRFWLWLSGQTPPRVPAAARPAPPVHPVTAAQASDLRATLGAALQARSEASRKQNP
ncbi:MAG TPA: hypothetical protein VF591_25520 [Pyrinomonadaceae bacterium]|jgi:hypothetical protein